VHRARLFERLDRGAEARLTLVVGRAGDGKTSLLADWVAARHEYLTAWLSCDESDREPVRFAGAIVEALRRSAGDPAFGDEARQLLLLDGRASADVVAALCEDLERLEEPLALVIDDFHLTGQAGSEVLARLVEPGLPALQLVVATRVDPPLRLHRMRANRELLELRERDLSFSLDEASLFMRGLGVHLSQPELIALYGQSEGWPAGLQMAALSIDGTTGTRRAPKLELGRHTVTGYLIDEVLRHQPADVVDFMLATSVLDELSEPACTAICGPSAGMLDQIYRDHLFVTMVDAESATYRYHSLIREVLRAELHSRDPASERRYHELAAGHMVDSGRVGAGARHLLAAGDVAAAFRVLGDGVIVDVGTDPAMGSRLSDLQPEDYSGRPEVLVPLAAELLLRGEFERGSRAFGLARMTQIDVDSDPDLAFRFAVVGSTYHHFHGEEHEALAYRAQAQRVLTKTRASDEWLVSLDATATYSHLHLGDFDQALQLAETVAAAATTLPAARDVFCAGIRSQVAESRGALSEADMWASRALDAAERLGFSSHSDAVPARRTKALLALERRDLAEAAELLEGILNVGRPFISFVSQVDRARVWAAEGKLDEALDSLPAARAALRSNRSVLLARADELEARIRLALGDAAGAIAITARLPDDRRLVVSAMIALAVGRLEQAEATLATAPAEPGTIRSALERELLLAELGLAQHSHHAPRLVRDVLDGAARHGFAQTVLDTAPRLVDHLVTEWEGYPRSAHSTRIVAMAVEARQHRSVPAPREGIIDPLTDAEIKVLRRLAQRLTYADIASDLHLSLNTVKTHLRHAYMKLGVDSRSAAIKRATVLGVL
jgi:LuxR family maltose regulon positive regulatory protein